VYLNWTASPVTINADGVAVPKFGINGKPAHLFSIDANVGDRVVLTYANNLPYPSALHFHGLFQRGTPFMDGPVGISQCAIAPGKSYTYEFELQQTGTYFWHAHYGLQTSDGLRGPLIIRDPKEKKYDSDTVIQLSDWYHAPSADMLAWYMNSETNPGGNEPVWDTGLINGIGQLDSIDCGKKTPYILTVAPGSTNRLRVVNAGTFAAFKFWIDGHDMTVIEVDGTRVEPHKVSVMTLNVAQRYSILIDAKATAGNYYIHANSYHKDPWISMNETQLSHFDADFTPNVKAILNYKGESNLKPIDPPRLCPYQASHVQTFLFEFSFGSRDGDDYQKAYPVARALQNKSWKTLVNSSYVPPMHEPIMLELHTNGSNYTPSLPTDNVIFLQHNQVIDIIIRNDDPGEHPFHIHGHNFWVMASGIVNSLTHIPRTYADPNPLLRDVVTDAWFGYAVIRFVADNPGAWIFHCHIGWHLSVGLSVTFVEGAELVPGLMRGAQVQQTC
ncbi:Cupredoxin, partial [Chytriomyces sp. MP71]